MLEQPAVKTLEKIANTLVKLGQYKSQADALRGIALEQVNRKIALYERRVKHLEKKHGTDFATYTRRLRNRATTQQEDEWLEWEAAIEMLDEWRKAKKAIEH